MIFKNVWESCEIHNTLNFHMSCNIFVCLCYFSGVIVTAFTSVSQPFCCSETFRKC